MDSFYIVLLTLLLYIFSQMIVHVLGATKTSTIVPRVRTKVFSNTFVAPIIFALIILFVVLTDNKRFSIFSGIGLIMGSLIGTFLRDRKYLTNFNLSDSCLEVEYVTTLLRTKTRTFVLTDIASIEMEKTNWLIEFPGFIKIESNNEWTKFYLVDKKLKQEVRCKLDEVKNSIAAL